MFDVKQTGYVHVLFYRAVSLRLAIDRSYQMIFKRRLGSFKSNHPIADLFCKI